MKAKKPKIMKKIVVVEDEPILLSFWERVLSELGETDVAYFSNSIEARLFLEETPCALLISDIAMPDFSGYELGKVACRRKPESKIILTTAYGTDLSRFNLFGCKFHLLHKPYTDITALKRFIKYMIDGYGSLDDISEESSSENEDYPLVTEWKI